MQSAAIKKRNDQIYKKRIAGITLAELAKEHNLSNERIRQICNRLKMRLSKRD